MALRSRPAAEVHIDIQLVRRLLVAQFPQWADLPLAPAGAAGLDNCIYRLGAELVVRLPRRALGAAHLEKERQWLPVLAPRLPLPVPVPRGEGVPAEGFPWHWTVCRWLAGRTAAVQPVSDLGQAAVVLAEFVSALQAIDPAGGPASEFRGGGGLLDGHDRSVRAAISALHDTFDSAAVIASWETALAAPGWTGAAVWMHGDLHPANLLVHHGRISAVIDFGLVAVGDPACDLMVAWTLLTAAARRRFRTALAVGDPAWTRARGERGSGRSRVRGSHARTTWCRDLRQMGGEVMRFTVRRAGGMSWTVRGVVAVLLVSGSTAATAGIAAATLVCLEGC